MSASNRSVIISKVQKVLKKHYKPVAVDGNRSVFDSLLFACLMVNAKHESAEAAFHRLRQSYFDWNEVRVTTVTELAERLGELPNPTEAATRLKRALQTIFESRYAFELEDLRKKNIGETVKHLSGLRIPRFAISYVVQQALGGHSIPLDQGSLDTMFIVGAINEKERDAGTVPGIERAISKKQGVDFASLLHEFGADLVASPYSSQVRSILLEISPDAQDRLPKRTVRRTVKKSVAKSAAAKKKKAGGRESKKPTKKVIKKTARKKVSSKGKASETKGKKAARGKKPSTQQLSKRKPK